MENIINLQPEWLTELQSESEVKVETPKEPISKAIIDAKDNEKKITEDYSVRYWTNYFLNFKNE